MKEFANEFMESERNGELHSKISQLSEGQVNELYNVLYPIYGIMNTINPVGLRALSEGKIELSTVDQVLEILKETELKLLNQTLIDENVQSLIAAFPVTDIVSALRSEQIRHDSYKGMTDDDLMAY